MNGLDASPCKRLLSAPWVIIPPEMDSSSASASCEWGSNGTNSEVESLDGMVYSGNVLSFFRPFLSSSDSAGPLQPMAVLQSRYDAVRREQNKLAHSVSIKSWFRCHRSGALHDLWWTSDVVIPGDVAASWKVDVAHSSGIFPLATYEAELLSSGTCGNDLLVDLFGKWRQSSGTVQFKSKKAAQKSAAFNLLIAVDLGEQPGFEGDSSDSLTNETGNKVKGGDMVSTGSEISMTLPKERFQLQSIRYYGAVQYRDGGFVSNCNPCTVQCIVSVKDVDCNNLSESLLDVASDFYQRNDDAFNDALDKLTCRMMARGGTVMDTNYILSAMKASEPNIAYEVTLPRWATEKIESKFYLLELEFLAIKGGNEIPFSEAIGLDTNLATRVGIVCGYSVYGDGCNVRDSLSADFTLSSYENVRVVMTNQTEVRVSEIIQQIEQTSPVINLGEGGCPIALIKCFNKILFDEGKTYGMRPLPGFGELLTRISEDDLAPSGRRSYMFVPLRPRSSSNHKYPSRTQVDWNVVSDVVHHQPLATAESIPSTILRNRFLTQPIGFKGRVFIAKNEGCTEKNDDDSPTTPSSPLFPEDMLSLLSDHFKEKILLSFEGLQLSEITCCRYYEQMWKYSIRMSADPLIAALSLVGLPYEQHESIFFHQICRGTTSTSTFDPSTQSSISNLLAASGLLVPELTLVLPMPRDFLYLCRRASNYIGKLERNYLLHVFASRLCDLQRNARPLISIPVSNTDIELLIDKATRGGTQEVGSVIPFVRDHERLEALGDSVLLHFIVLNLFVQMHSSTTDFVLDVFEQVVTNQGKNRLLFKAALQIGLHRLIIAGNSPAKITWRYARSTMELAEKQLSNTLESLLGATFLIDPSGYMTVGLLNEIGPCFPDNFAPGVNLNPSGNWFSGKGTCLITGYPFHESPGTAELVQIKGILERNHQVHSILQSKATAFCQLLAKRIIRHDQLEFLQSDPISSLLLHSALFDDSLDDDEHPDFIGLESLAKLRDKIFNVGNAALQLSIVSEIYHLYPASTSGDIHLMKTVLMSHDSLAYILLKNRFHHCLFDENAYAIIVMKGYMNEADLLGSKEWVKNGGWVIGGIEEFQRRVEHHGHYSCPNPRYMGLAAGRLMGHMKKLPDNASEDLQFSMKAIFGAVALSVGVKDAWDMIRPFFLELMMLSPDELRVSFAGISDLASLYQKGRR
jgi:dsRNA-specific ribonuclease